MSMALHRLVAAPLLVSLERQLPGLFVARSRSISQIIAYLYDVTVLIEQPAVLHRAVETCENATGAILNTRKSKVLPLATWKSHDTFRQITVRAELRVLRIMFGKSISLNIQFSWRTTDGHCGPWRVRHITRRLVLSSAFSLFDAISL
jgi:hypothetical protein